MTDDHDVLHLEVVHRVLQACHAVQVLVRGQVADVALHKHLAGAQVQNLVSLQRAETVRLLICPEHTPAAWHMPAAHSDLLGSEKWRVCQVRRPVGHALTHFSWHASLHTAVLQVNPSSWLIHHSALESGDTVQIYWPIRSTPTLPEVQVASF